jgi:hypothetical protein
MPSLGSHLAFNQFEARNAVIQNLSAAPSGPVRGQLYYDTVANALYFYNGTIWISASGGTPADATTTTKGVVQLANALGGTAAAPAINNGYITDPMVAAANKDGAVGTPSMRTLGAGAVQALAGNTPLNSIAQPVAAVNYGGQNLSNLGSPVAASDAATKSYVDNTAAGLSAKNACICATTANITLSGLQAIDGYTTLAGDRVLVKNQTTTSANGIYTAAAGAWTRSTDMNSWAQVPSAYCWVEQGTTLADTGWVCTSDPGGTLGSTAITWVQFTGAAQITAGAGLQKAGNTLSVLADGTTIDTAGAGSSVEVRAGGIGDAQIAAGGLNPTKLSAAVAVAQGGTGQTTAKTARETGLGAAGYYSATGPGSAGASWSITQATHGLRAQRGIQVQVQDNTSGAVELPDVTVDASGNVTITYAVSQTVNAKLVVLVG